jgi:NAD(P)H dehydrogenase (quinone)
MKHAVIFAHPNPEGFTSTMARAYVEAADQHGHEAIVRDLYGMGFDPCLKLEEIPNDHLLQPGPEVIAERGVLRNVDVFVFIYPFWFNAAPAILKGYVDRVFCMGFGFAHGPGGMEPLLEDRKLISFTSSGAPLHWVRDTGAWRTVRKLFDEHLSEVCGLTVIDHVHFGEITTGIHRDAVLSCAEEVRVAFADHFGKRGHKGGHKGGG